MNTLYDDYSRAVAQQIATYRKFGWLRNEVEVNYKVVEHNHIPSQALILRTPLVTVEYRNTHHSPHAPRPSTLGGCAPMSAAYWLAILHLATEYAFDMTRVTALTKVANWPNTPIVVKFRVTQDVSNPHVKSLGATRSDCFVSQRINHPIGTFLHGRAQSVDKQYEPELPYDALANQTYEVINDKPKARKVSREIAKSLQSCPLLLLCTVAHALSARRFGQLTELPSDWRGSAL